jgi:LPXTG-motif cell wall-anchored protein
MRRWVIGMAAVGLLLTLSSPAVAQTSGLRDPFEPLISPEDETSTDTTTTDTTTTDPTDTGATVTVADPDDGLPNTGSNATDWLAIAYVLVAAGAGALAFARVNKGGPFGNAAYE